MFQFFGAIDDQKRIQTLTGPEDVLERFFMEKLLIEPWFFCVFFLLRKNSFPHAPKCVNEVD